MIPMADIVMADDGISFDGESLGRGPLGGAETAFLSLARAFAARGHRVRVRNRCTTSLARDGVEWAPLSVGLPETCDLYIANRSDKLLSVLDGARRTIFWIHNPARYLLKFRYLWKLWRRRPPIVFSGPHHASTYPAWAPDGGRVIIPYGISEDFRSIRRDAGAPPPRAVFTSSPLRGLDWLLDLWRDRIRPACPSAELHVFSGAATYGSFGTARIEAIRPVLERAASLAADGVVLREPVPKAALATELARARVLLYRGDPGETFCLAVGEAQAAGVPAVVQDIGCVAERVLDGETGFVARGDSAFAHAAIRLLGDDGLWRAQSGAAIARQRGWGWDQAAAAFEELMS
jgi:glycosyltransferase involved in cell wall biosynthesis